MYNLWISRQVLGHDLLEDREVPWIPRLRDDVELSAGLAEHRVVDVLEILEAQIVLREEGGYRHNTSLGRIFRPPRHSEKPALLVREQRLPSTRSMFGLPTTISIAEVCGIIHSRIRVRPTPFRFTNPFSTLSRLTLGATTDVA